MPIEKKYSIFPIENANLWAFYKKQSYSFWIPEEIDLSADLQDFERMSKDEQYFIKHVLAFFNQSDGIVNENLVLRFYDDVNITEVRAFYAMQMAIEAVHSETYSLLLETYIKDNDEKQKLFNAIENIPTISEKAKWAFKWISSADSFSNRLFAFATIEGLFFSGSFCAIYWLKKRGLMPGLSKANDFISRDEGLHWTFAAELSKHLRLESVTGQQEQWHAIIKEAVDIETHFITHALSVDLIGMNSKLMEQYIQYTADRILQHFGVEKLYSTENPFDFMSLLDMENKSNFFETRVSEYSKGADKQLDFTSEF